MPSPPADPPNHDTPDGPALAAQVKAIAEELGFDDCRIAPAIEAPHADRFREWVEAKTYGDMEWLSRNVERRTDPRIVQPGAKAVIVLALNYYPGDPEPIRDDGQPRGRIARYSWNNDYHDLIVKKLKIFNEKLEALGGIQRYYTDTGPVLERDFASEAGMGWNGKSTVQIHRKLGTWFFLAELITTLDLPADERSPNYCGSCTRCMDNCPTNAITAPNKMDALRCISYLTIEHKGSIPEELRPMMGDRIYGCDRCLEVCPWNKFAKMSRDAFFHARKEIFDLSLRDMLALDDEQFRTIFSKSPIKRTKHPKFLRNVCVAVGNVGTSDDIPALKAAIERFNDPLINEHAEWAIEQIQQREKQ
ncbi:tRNA epoxyqueuosine(34) reductase QueG [Sulfuriroseicoccus oceanibius]|uniref:tRNA epoxyqueuosine(34) reductase QueG n=1 Tax=Sulfuriroseicoccus oceanibius TaxID=2707525 RepID=A0A6B3LDT1_9BACT|nr:tRNA epoxyqueuosine(34) reductase QueG [Sulfuriroseicoccus oceanibius]QQL45065.1 tRNA epoxyqueuosine(34) reductase QueG [Sulfuriroseicoccus oceanibius]